MNRIKIFSRFALLLILLLSAATFPVVKSPELAYASKSLPANVHILLGFKERYGEANKQHLGIDVYAAKGAELHAPIEGIVSFVGRVPGSAGLNVTALTISTTEGQQISINPFASVSVKKGDKVEKGQILGIVSDVGDPSSPESHFHLSLRVGGVYRDPTHLLFEDIFDAKENGKPPEVAQGTLKPINNKPSVNPAPAPSPVSVSAPAQAASKASNQAAAKESAQASNKASAKQTEPKKSKSSELQKSQLNTNSSGVQSSTKESVKVAPDKAIQKSNKARTKAEGSQQKPSLDRSNSSLNSAAVPNSIDEEVINKSSSMRVGEANWIKEIAGTDQFSNYFGVYNSETKRLLPVQASAAQFGITEKTRSIGLHAEAYNYFASLSQIHLTAIMILVAMFLSCAGLGVVRLVQLIGIDAIASRLGERVALGLKQASKKI